MYYLRDHSHHKIHEASLSIQRASKRNNALQHHLPTNFLNIYHGKIANIRSTHLTIEERLSQSHITLSNANSDSTVQSILVSHGYTSERISDGWALYNSAQTRCQQQESAYGALTRASQELQTSERDARSAFAGHRALALVAFRNDTGSLRDLGLYERVCSPARSG